MPRINDKVDLPVDIAQLQSIAEHCSSSQRNSEAAENTLKRLIILDHLKRQAIGKTFNGTIMSVQKQGLWVELELYLLEVWLPIDRHWRYDFEQQVWRKGSVILQAGDGIEVKLVDVDMFGEKALVVFEAMLKPMPKRIKSRQNRQEKNSQEPSRKNSDSSRSSRSSQSSRLSRSSNQSKRSGKRSADNKKSSNFKSKSAKSKYRKKR